MLDRLRHDRVIRRHDDQSHVNPRRAGDHGSHETLVAGNVHDSESRVADGQFGKAQLNRHAAALFFRQAVRVDSRQSTHQRRLAVVDMPGRSENVVRPRPLRL